MKHVYTLVIFLLVSAAQAQTLTDSLIAHFPMDGDAIDTVDNLEPSVIQGSPGFCTDRFGNENGAACFDGASFWSYGDVLDMDTSDFSIAGWFHADTIHPPFDLGSGTWGAEWLVYSGVPLGKGTTVYGTPPGSGYIIALRQLNPNDFTLNGFTGNENGALISSTASIVLHYWTHFVLSRCGPHQTLHLNGVLVADALTALSRDLGTNIHFTIGAVDRDPTAQPDTDFFIGSLDDIRMYKGRCLSQAEIDTLAETLTVGIDPGVHRPQMLLSPNPASDILWIQLAQPIDLSKPIDVFDAMGRKQSLSASALTLQGNGVTQVELSVVGLAPGAYIVRLIGTDGEVHGRFVKE